MPHKILHVLSSCFFAGSTAYAIVLSEKQVMEGHDVFMITDTGDLSGKFPCLPLPVSNRSMVQRFKNIRFLRTFIREHQIEIVHAHSRAASWISYYAVFGSKVALISTIHGRQVKHSMFKKIDVFGNRIISICPNLRLHLEREMKFNTRKLITIPNGFDLEYLHQFKRERTDDGLVMSYIGRFNGPKGENIVRLVIDIFPILLKEYPRLSIQLIGGEWDSFPEQGKKAYGQLKLAYNERIKHLGFSQNVHQLIVDSDLLIGAGRVAMEGIFHGIPVLAMGEACCHGFLTSANIQEAIDSNFGDILPVKQAYQFNTTLLLKDLFLFLDNPKHFQVNLQEFMEGYDIQNVFPEIMKVYRYAIMRKAYSGALPILMYHKTPEEPSQSKHRIFVTKDNFEKHLRFFKFRGLTTITFKEYQDYLFGRRPIREFPKKPVILTFDDGYRDNYHHMLPLAQKYNFKGVLFLLGDSSLLQNTWDQGEDSEENRLMTSQQKLEFVKYGWEIGAHTLTHADLTLIPESQAFFEIQKSKALLESEFPINIISFAYPFGNYNDTIKGLVFKSGYTYGISTDTGGENIEDDPYAIFRVNIFPEDNIFQLYKKTSSWYRKYYFQKREKVLLKEKIKII